MQVKKHSLNERQKLMKHGPIEVKRKRKKLFRIIWRNKVYSSKSDLKAVFIERYGDTHAGCINSLRLSMSNNRVHYLTATSWFKKLIKLKEVNPKEHTFPDELSKSVNPSFQNGAYVLVPEKYIQQRIYKWSEKEF